MVKSHEWDQASEALMLCVGVTNQRWSWLCDIPEKLHQGHAGGGVSLTGLHDVGVASDQTYNITKSPSFE